MINGDFVGAVTLLGAAIILIAILGCMIFL